ncbi:uncharacterized protein N7469_004906 [Penicillium citrinum]|uniref:Uncharacterized protein n=2 Tax=Penicillium TaxID=5073 RepID=A0A9W9P7Z1_PENCI|nr:uncharacterized protein N7469_004906 [Penicillium citrinum]KAJ5235738.1 hypothetical protein N7469_004906 [Penicillium citrinum]KAJ5591301.1 hypothetical protein N7450_005273 [Penicillium hetheringtonii]KAK5799915.1 hypothetical protein VI817_002127 [Penicillium citrinum]
MSLVAVVYIDYSVMMQVDRFSRIAIIFYENGRDGTVTWLRAEIHRRFGDVRRSNCGDAASISWG